LSKKNTRHGNADFCDLTHCQVYRGRMNSSISFHDDWVIDQKKLRHDLFFHSRCGGKTFDSGVFRGKAIDDEHRNRGVRDWLYREGIQLCSARDSRWEQTIGKKELVQILFAGKENDGDAFRSIQYNRDHMMIEITTSSGITSFPVETFRLKINKVKGWNFIRSNNFTVSDNISDNEKQYIFRGEGLGHGVGLCQHGSMALSRLGYNRYEILEHYFPDLQLQCAGNQDSLSPYCSYCLFDVSTGKILKSTQGKNLLSRTVPPGSLFKVIVALYLAAERPDIIDNYTYHCSGRNMNDPNLPDRCWKPKGHGTIRLKEALPNSCNLYFSSLYKKIPEKQFRAFFRNFCSSLDISPSLPETANDRQWAELLAGLDFRVSFTIGDLIKLARYCYCGNGEVRDLSDSGIPVPYQERMKLFQGLRDTFIHGTASKQKKRSGPSCNYLPLEKNDEKKSMWSLTDLWGKTATVLGGTSTPVSYGLFMGGNGATGIIVVLRKGTGNLASRWARKILDQEKRND
jgi:SpoIID/LytB domain protein